METKIQITPERDTFNSYPTGVDFHINGSEVKIDLVERELTFNVDDIAKLLEVSKIMEK